MNWDNPLSQYDWQNTTWQSTAEYHDIDVDELKRVCGGHSRYYDMYLTYCNLMNSPLCRALE